MHAMPSCVAAFESASVRDLAAVSAASMLPLHLAGGSAPRVTLSVALAETPDANLPTRACIGAANLFCVMHGSSHVPLQKVKICRTVRNGTPQSVLANNVTQNSLAHAHSTLGNACVQVWPTQESCES